MSETISKVEKADIQIPELAKGETAIVFQRHERYERARDSETSGSIFPDHAEAAQQRDFEEFQKLLAEDAENTYVMFVSSDTQYAGKGRRSLETGQLAQDAAIEAMKQAGVNPNEHVINLNDDFNTDKTEVTGQDIRTVKGLIEPQIFDDENGRAYVSHLRDKYGAEDGAGTGISQAAWAAHESDAEKEVRESFGAEGVGDILDRTKHSLAVLERYARIFHTENPDKRLVIWATSHYDTISPFVKDATGQSFDEYVPVDYGGGVVLKVPSAETKQSTELIAQGHKVKIALGKKAINS